MQRTKQRQKQEQQHKPYVKVESLICWVYYGLTTPTPVLHGKFSDFEKCTKRRYDYHSCIIGFLRGSQSVLNYIITCFQSLVGLIQISSLVSPRWSPGAVSLMTCCLSKPGIHGLNPGRIHSNKGVKTAYPFLDLLCNLTPVCPFKSTLSCCAVNLRTFKTTVCQRKTFSVMHTCLIFLT